MSNVLRALLCLLVVQTAMIPALPVTSGSEASGMTYRERITAHRGSSESAPENTLSAFRQAIRAGAGYAELDVQETSDGVVMVMHDDNVRRTTGIDKPMWQVTSAELASASAGSWFGERYAAEKVPTLEQVIDTAQGRIKLNIELKNNGHGVRLAEKSADIVKRKSFGKDCIFTSFDGKLLHRVKQADPELRTGLIVDKLEGAGALEKLLRNPDYDALSIAHPLVKPELLKLAGQYGKDIFAWTVNDPEVMKRMLELGVSSIITDKPRLLAKVAGERLQEQMGTGAGEQKK
ncbi:glycerophosphodiester phosphodiesterase family protein [Paenibacillus filicis]|uniref:Glycerophosphodiester phosphodiesterase family protein n=1 Tax=Paenibacillus filicis TaxID=669464 RepID=A0ABU9DG18_9BACL